MRAFALCILAFLCLVAVFQRSGETEKVANSYTTTVLMWGVRGREDPGSFEKPRSICLADDRSVAVLDVSGRIQRFDVRGQYLNTYPLPDVSPGNPQYIAKGGWGTALVADTHNNRILRLGTDGIFTPVIDTPAASPGSARPGELFWPCGVVESPDGFIYTIEYGGHDRVQKWSAGGKWIASWGRFGTGEGEFRRPSGLAVGAGGELYVADSVNNRIQVFAPDGEWLRSWDASASPQGRLACPFDVAIVGNDTIAILEYAASRVRLFSDAGEELYSWGGQSRDNGGLLYPWGMTADASGALYVADTLNHRIVRIEVESMQKIQSTQLQAVR